MSDQNNNFPQDNQKQPGAYYDGSSSNTYNPNIPITNNYVPNNSTSSYAGSNISGSNNPGSNNTYYQDPNNGYGQFNNQNPNPYNTGYVPSQSLKPPVDGLAVVSLISSIISVVFCWAFPLTILFSIVGLVCGLISKKVDGKRSGLAVAGIIISIIMLIIGIISAIIIIAGLSQFSFSNEFDTLFEELEKLN
ncbi:MAG: hypothetical protein K0R15_2076 [Clostridiales bacterium]|jgi:hypothetical protein|nr:hypothetical protein [Clostridiales bacterium]